MHTAVCLPALVHNLGCMQGKLLQGFVGPLDRMLGLAEAHTTAGKLIQLARSVPGVTGVLVGHKV